MVLRKVVFTREYFELQIRFVKEVSRVLNKPYVELLGSHTDLTNRFRIKCIWDNYEKDKDWKDFLKNYFSIKDPVGSSYGYYLKRSRMKLGDEYKNLQRFFRYELEGKYVIRVHTNLRYSDNNGFSPLDKKNINKRKKELAEIFKEIKEKHPERRFVHGHSWLYEIRAYKRLFPNNFVNNIYRYKWIKCGLSIWGQFLDKEVKIKKEMREEFLKKISKAKNMKEIWEAFPHFPIYVRGNIKDFYKKYEIN